MFFDRIFKPKNENSKRFRREMAKSLDLRAIKYCAERIDNKETVLGHSGMINLRGGELILLSSDKVVFRCPVDELSASELMSRDGVVLSGRDLEHGGELRTVTAFYTDPYRVPQKR